MPGVLSAYPGLHRHPADAWVGGRSTGARRAPGPPEASWQLRAPASFRTLPLSGRCEQDPQLSASRIGERGRSLDDELIDEQKRHSGFEVVKQLLQSHLLHLATSENTDKSRLAFRALQFDLGRQDVAAAFRHAAA